MSSRGSGNDHAVARVRRGEVRGLPEAGQGAAAAGWRDRRARRAGNRRARSSGERRRARRGRHRRLRGDDVVLFLRRKHQQHERFARPFARRARRVLRLHQEPRWAAHAQHERRHREPHELLHDLIGMPSMRLDEQLTPSMSGVIRSLNELLHDLSQSGCLACSGTRGLQHRSTVPGTVMRRPAPYNTWARIPAFVGHSRGTAARLTEPSDP